MRVSIALGARGGTVRLSSGYAHNIQSQVGKLANNIR